MKKNRRFSIHPIVIALLITIGTNIPAASQEKIKYDPALAAKYGAEYVLLETPDDLERFTQKQQVKILVTVDHWNLARINL